MRSLVKLLIQVGHRVYHITGGQAALQEAILQLPDLILLDTTLPEISGYELCRLFKEMEHTCDIPIIFLSANHEPLDKVQAFRFGAVDYITKPFESTEVLVRIETQLKIHHCQQQLQEQNRRLQNQNLELQQELCQCRSALAELNRELELQSQAYGAALHKVSLPIAIKPTPSSLATVDNPRLEVVTNRRIKQANTVSVMQAR
ncbi:MAG: hypothetical protein Kow00121_40640 [Elainellaceae cyanobacterium]